MYKKMLVLLLLLSVSGCPGSPFQLAHMNANQLTSVTDEQLLQALTTQIKPRELMIDEAKRRGWLTDDEIELVKQKKIRIGMSERALKISWGYPSDINRTVGSFGVHKQCVYGTYSGYSSPTYVYVENGKVTSWQD